MYSFAGLTVAQAERIAKEGLSKYNTFYAYAPNSATYHCPGDTRTKLATLAAGWAYDSYSRSANVGGEAGGTGAAAFFGAGDTYRKMSGIRSPSMTMTMVEEADGGDNYNFATWAALWTNGGSDPASSDQDSFRFADSVAVFHGDVSSFAMADGRAELHKWTDPELIACAKKSANGGGSGTVVTNPGTPDYNWVFQHYRHPNNP